MLEAAKDRGKNLALQASWANMSWSQVLSSTLGLLVDPAVLEQLEMQKASPADPRATEMAEAFARLVIGTASKRAWSMAVYELPGKAFAGWLDADVYLAQEAFQKSRTDWEIIQRALRLQGDPDCQDSEARFLV